VQLAPRQPATDRGHYRAAPLTLEEMRREFGVAPGEPLPDFSMMPAAKLAQLARYATPPGTYFDAYPLHIGTTASLAAMAARAPGAKFEPARFRANLLVRTEGEALLEPRWCGGALHAGGISAAVEVPTPRCSMPTHAQPGIAADPAVLRALVQH